MILTGWQTGVLPAMAPRLGVHTTSSFNEALHSPYMTVLTKAVSAEDWGKIVRYYREQSPDALPYQSLPAEPQLDPGFFKTGPFVPRLPSSGIIAWQTEPSLGHMPLGRSPNIFLCCSTARRT